MTKGALERDRPLSTGNLDFDVMFDPGWDGYAEETSHAFESPFRDEKPT